jgi:segregation and condensation protein B
MPYIDRVLQPVKKTSLSQSTLETLAIIAYKQPITRFEIEQIRGVQCNYSVAMLIEKGLVMRTGRKKSLGNPMLYATSDEFLRHFGISSLDELPKLKEAE